MEVLNRKTQKSELAAIGVDGAAAERLLSEYAGDRHRSRVRYARNAAEEYYLSQCAVEREDISPESLAMVVSAILWADMVGVGGRDDVQGLSTERHPAFHQCGKGRKQASDGPAWTAAILEAAHLSGGRFSINENGLLVFSLLDGSDVAICDEIAPPRWRYAILREGLRRSVERAMETSGTRPNRWHENVPFDAPPSSAPSWARAVNEATLAESSEDKSLISCHEIVPSPVFSC